MEVFPRNKILTVLSPSVTNSGTLASTNANVNLGTSIAAAMNVNNSGGTISALNGSINIRNEAYDAAFNTIVNGGDLLSKDVNAYTGGGTTDVYVNELTGIVIHKWFAHTVSANTSDLIIGNQCLVGDPTYYQHWKHRARRRHNCRRITGNHCRR